MKPIWKLATALLLARLATLHATPLAIENVSSPASPMAWPPITRECRPWAYHWWLGSAVDKENLAREFRRYREGGLGGLHIVPIYGVKGAEARYIEYLSPQWMAMLDFAVREADVNDLGIDMTTGTGWCFGGPNVPENQASFFILPHLANAPVNPSSWALSVPRGERVLVASAIGTDGHCVSISDQVSPEGRVDWFPPSSGWRVAFISGRTGIKVKRAAPGGVGFMINPIASDAMRNYLNRFTHAFAPPAVVRPRAMYHDSYEYHMGFREAGEWSADFLDQFTRLRGYSLAEKLPELASLGDPDIVARVRSDYRETVSDLMIDQVFPQWVEWCHRHGIRTRNQAHGSPASVLDFYSISDIPECEGTDERAKLASSAAHVMGRRLVSCESCTWLDQHFHETFKAIKRTVDYQMVRGVNHIFYHGCVYSPDDAVWPGWLFYAATQMNPRNPLWREAPALNTYIARAQSVLQTGTPDHDVLLYNSLHDLWHDAKHFAIHKGTVSGSGQGSDCSLRANAMANRLWKSGVAYDWITDRLLARTHISSGRLRTPGSTYHAIVVPAVEHMPLDTARQLLFLAQGGATVIFENALPQDVPGFKDYRQRRAKLHDLFAVLPLKDQPQSGLKVARVGRGCVMIGDALTALATAGVARETLTDAGLEFIRRRLDDGRYYFLVNPSSRTVETTLALATPACSIVAFDPITGRSGMLPLLENSSAGPAFAVYLEPGHSIILRTFEGRPVTGPVWRWSKPAGPPIALNGTWQVEFVAGGPQLPRPWTVEHLASWTTNGDPVTLAYAGTAIYRKSFDLPPSIASVRSALLLDLGEVREVARVRLNGRDLGTVFFAPFRVRVDKSLLKQEGNMLEIEVTNLGANRVRDLDRRKVAWKIFHDANVMSLPQYWREKSVTAGFSTATTPRQGLQKKGGLDATNWPVRDAGLLGPVTLTPTGD